MDEADEGAAAQAGGLDDALARLAAWRERGADAADPVRFGFIEALARRAGGHQGAARRVLEDKLRGLLAAYGETLARRTGEGRVPGVPGPDGGKAGQGAAPEVPAAWRVKPERMAGPKAAAAHHGDGDGLKATQAVRRTGAAPRVASPAAQPLPDPGRPAAPRGALAALVDDVSRRNTHGTPPGSAAPAALPGLGKAPELKALSRFRSTWSKLSADQRLKQSLAKLPGNAGPLNSQQLVHRSLVSMRDLSPQYLHLFMSYVDTLAWLTDAQDSGPAPASPNNPPGRRKA